MLNTASGYTIICKLYVLLKISVKKKENTDFLLLTMIINECNVWYYSQACSKIAIENNKELSHFIPVYTFTLLLKQKVL